MTKKTTAEIKKFKADYAKIKSSIKELKKKLVALKKEITPISIAAYKLYERGDTTMYDENECGIITPKFNGISSIMEDLGYWIGLGSDINNVIGNL